MSSINFDNAWLLLLALPLVVLFVIPYAIAVRRDNLNGHNIASGIIHIIMALLIAFAAAGTSIVTTVTETNVYVVADVSHSAEKNLGAIDGYISDISKSLPRNSKLGVITFGKYYQLLTPLGGKVRSVKETSAGVDKSATDIIGALRYTGELFREDVIKRIVLITDGNQTSESDANALKRQVDALAERNIHVDAIYLDDNIKDEREVQLSTAEVTPTTFINSKASARLTVNINYPVATAGNSAEAPYEVQTFVSATRTRTDAEGAEAVEHLAKKRENFTLGSNYYDLPLFTEEAGVYDYTVKIEAVHAEQDANALNNVISFTQEVADKQNVLVIYDD
ncbi:MAG: VWA domain-containing protein, partial [Clostridia bacterium]|nr:VWA domain-containing protein [Clostridia bacterium]